MAFIRFKRDVEPCKQECKRIGLKVRKEIELRNVASVKTETGKEIYNHGTSEYQLRWESKIELLGESDVFEPVYTKLNTINESDEYRVINVKGIPNVRSPVMTFDKGVSKQVVSLGQKDVKIDLVFWVTV